MQRRSRLASVLVSLVLVAGGLYGLAHWQDVFDWWRLRNYDPPAAIAQLADSTTMTPAGRKDFYVHYPSLDDKVAFNQHCNEFEHSVVLGCYIRARGIYIYDVQDPRLAGIKEVTAAHEMLHAAYDRLGSKDRTRIDSLTAQTFAALNDKRVKDTIEQYRARDPSVVPNELHSILATEVRELPAELEQYYAKYFVDRSKVVEFSEHYEGEFTSRKAQVEAYDVQLKSLKSQIDSAQASLETQAAQLKSDRNRLDAQLSAGNYDAYNAAVPGFNARVRAYNNAIASAEAKIEQYNDIVKARNAITVEEAELQKALDSRLTTQPSQ